MSKTKWDDREDRIEYLGTIVVNAQKAGLCAWCGERTDWYDIVVREFLCSEECTVSRHLEISEGKGS